jgi:hypothetical protein
MNTFTIIIRKGPYHSQNASNWIGEGPLQTFEEVVDDLVYAQVEGEEVEKIITINLSDNAATDVTIEAADAVWCVYDSNNRKMRPGLKEWVEGVSGNPCDHLTGEFRDIRDFYGQ